MVSNFQFLKSINNSLYEIIVEAERLYQDEYFDQCMTQTRRFGENVCKDMLIQNKMQTGSFDEMISTLEFHANGNTEEKEFINDLYFLKKNGNQSTHAKTIKKDGVLALECLQRAFEVAINYSVYNQHANSNLLKLNYDVELLVTGKKSKTSLKERFENEKAKQKIQPKPEKTSTKVTKPSFETKKEKKNYTKRNNENGKIQIKVPFFWKAVGFFSIISVVAILFLVVVSLV